MLRKLFILSFAAALILSSTGRSTTAFAQAGSAETVLILPFENLSDHPEYNWIGESFADSLSALLNKPGLIVISGDERAVAYQRLRLPLTVLPSRATAIKIARELKASLIVIGNYNVTLPASDVKSLATIAGEARVVRINEGRMA